MRIPEPVKAVFDTFPLQTYPELDVPESKEQNNIILYVPSLDSAGRPLDPQSILAESLLKRLGEPYQLKIGSPYLTNKETLPATVLVEDKQVTLFNNELIAKVFPDSATDSQTTLYRSLVDIWLNDAWFATILAPKYTETFNQIYQSPQDNAQPWPVSAVITKQARELIASQRSYTADEEVNESRIRMALKALGELTENTVDELSDREPTLMELMIHAYITAIEQAVPDSSVGQAVAGTRLPKVAEAVSKAISATRE